jgi:hypothetical protein
MTGPEIEATDPEIEEPEDGYDREFMQGDDEMCGEDFSEKLKRLGMTEDEYWAMETPDPR